MRKACIGLMRYMWKILSHGDMSTEWMVLAKSWITHPARQRHWIARLWTLDRAEPKHFSAATK